MRLAIVNPKTGPFIWFCEINGILSLFHIFKMSKKCMFSLVSLCLKWVSLQYNKTTPKKIVNVKSTLMLTFDLRRPSLFFIAHVFAHYSIIKWIYTSYEICSNWKQYTKYRQTFFFRFFKDFFFKRYFREAVGELCLFAFIKW